MAFLGGDMNKSSSHPPVNLSLSGPQGLFHHRFEQDQVLAAQGQPSSFSSDRFSYGLSEVKFDSSGRIEGLGFLFIKLKAMIEIDAGKYSGMSYFTIGSSKELVAVQGQPTSVLQTDSVMVCGSEFRLKREGEGLGFLFRHKIRAKLI